jgi:hypothetical protein
MKGASDLDRPRIGFVDARQELQQGALAGAVAADDAEELALADVEGDPEQGVQLAVVARGEGMDGALFQRIDPLGRNPEGLVQIPDPDGDRGVGAGRGGRQMGQVDFLIYGHRYSEHPEGPLGVVKS